jgi:predicted transcriptional regulator of viral defense system
MNAAEAYSRLRRLRVPVLETADAAALLEQSTFAASQTLSRLARAGLVTAVRHGTWWIDGEVDPHRLPEYLTAPQPSYLSLQTALHLRGVIEQIPDVLYVVSLARTQRTIAMKRTFSIHHVTPEVFGGFDELPSGVKLATVEKALFDFAYLSGGRSRLFTSLPEVELPRGLRHKELMRWVEKIPSARSRTLTLRRLEAIVAGFEYSRRSYP